jgi:hypothetical protein
VPVGATEPTSVHLLTPPSQALRHQAVPFALLLVLAGPGQQGHAQQNRDPFDVQRLRPAAPSSFW